MNPAGFSYAGFALKDCLKGAALPYVEVHISSIAKRQIQCVLSDVAEGLVAGSECIPTSSVSRRCLRFCGHGASRRSPDSLLNKPEGPPCSSMPTEPERDSRAAPRIQFNEHIEVDSPRLLAEHQRDHRQAEHDA